MRPFTCHDRFIRDVRHKKHPGGRPRVWHQCPWCSLKFNGRQWLSHEHNCPSRTLRPEPEQVVDFGRVKNRVFGKPPVKRHKCPFCKNKFTGREWLAHTCKERSRITHGGMWLTPTPSDGGGVSSQTQKLTLPQTQPLAPVLPRRQERPLGPGDCKRRSFPGRCSKCGVTVRETHLLMRVRSGVFCERCCPACHSGARYTIRAARSCDRDSPPSC